MTEEANPGQDVNPPEGTNSNADPNAAKPPEELTEIKEQLAQVKKSSDEYRSFSDRKIGELSDQNKKLDAMLSVMKEQHNAGKSERDKLSQQQFNDQWKTRIDEEGAEATMEFIRGTQSEVRDSLKSEVESIVSAQVKELKEVLAPLQQRIADNDPDYVANKETVDKLMEVAPNLDRESAIAIAKQTQPSVQYSGGTPAPGSSQHGTVQPQDGDNLDLQGAEALMLRLGSDRRYSGTVGDEGWKKMVEDVAKERKN